MEMPDAILPQSRGGRAMVFTHEESVPLAIARGLGPFGLTCEVHTLSAASVRYACSEPLDLILVDMHQGAGESAGGAILTAQLLKATPNHETVPFVALCSSADEVALAHSSRLFDIVLETPFSIARVRAAVFTAYVRKRSFSFYDQDMLRAGQFDVGLSEN
jgi:DNA-binding response OmpR family regulator